MSFLSVPDPIVRRRRVRPASRWVIRWSTRYLEFVAGSVPAEHVAGGRARPEDVLHGRRQGPGRGRGGRTCSSSSPTSAATARVVRISDRRVGPVGAHDRPAAVVDLGVLRVSASPAATRRCASNPVPRGLSTRRRGGRRAHGAVGAGAAHAARRSCRPARSTALLGGAAHRIGTGRWSWRWCWAGCAAARSSACASRDVQVAERSLFIAEGKGGHQRVVPISNTFFAAVGDYLRDERPTRRRTDRVFVTLKGPTPRPAADRRRRRRDPRRRPPPRRAGAGDVSSAAPHLPDPAARSRAWRSKRSRPRPVTARSSRPAIYLHLTDDWLAGEYRRAAERIDADARRRAPRDAGDRPDERRRRRTAEPWVPTDASHREWAALSAPGTAAGRHDAPLPGCSSPRSWRRAASTSPTARCASSPAGSTDRHRRRPSSPRSAARHIEDYKVWLAAQPGSQGADACRRTPNGTGCG